MSLHPTPLVPINFDGNRYLNNEADPMDTREDYHGFGLIGSNQAAWVWQQITKVKMTRSDFWVAGPPPAYATIQIPGRSPLFPVPSLRPTHPTSSPSSFPALNPLNPSPARAAPPPQPHRQQQPSGSSARAAAAAAAEEEKTRKLLSALNSGGFTIG